MLTFKESDCEAIEYPKAWGKVHSVVCEAGVWYVVFVDLKYHVRRVRWDKGTPAPTPTPKKTAAKPKGAVTKSAKPSPMPPSFTTE